MAGGEMSAKRRIGVMGGTFNPIHMGHLRSAEEVLEGFGLDKVLFIPAFEPPHKEVDGMIGGDVRLRMVELAVADNPRFEASNMETARGGKSYTVETLRELKAQSDGAEVTLIIGSDSYNDIATWCEYEDIFTLSDIAVVARPGAEAKKPADTVPVEVARKFWYDENSKGYASSYGGTVFFPSTTMVDISSTKVRELVRAGASIRYLVPDAVARFISDEGLYGGAGP